MQRTVYSTKFTYADTTLTEDGTVRAEIKTVVIHETDENKALRMAHKKVGNFKALKTEKISELYVLDDEIFFKYAKVKGDEDEKGE